MTNEPDHDRAAAPAFAEGLFTDLYELTMAQAYLAQGMTDTAVFELFFRAMPEQRSFVMAAGLADVVAYVESIRFTDGDLAYLADQGQFTDAFLDLLRNLRFTGDVLAVPEGTIVFPNEPVVQIVAPIVEAQIIETFVLNQVHFQSVAATKAARLVLAARGRDVVDFGSRRSHGIDAALKVARVAYLAGCAGTSNVLAGRRYDIPVFGTMAHSYVQAHDDEMSAFRAFARQYPETTLLVDTYDTLAGVDRVIDLARDQGDDLSIGAIRLDSGDLAELAKAARSKLDAAQLQHVRIVASSGLDEHKIADLLRADAPIDAFGVGTKLAVSRDVPDLDFAYKLVAYADQPRTKLSSGKTIYPGQKQVFRECRRGVLHRDVLALHDESHAGQALLEPVIRNGEHQASFNLSLDAAREHARACLKQLPESLTGLEPVDDTEMVCISPLVRQQLEQLSARG